MPVYSEHLMDNMSISVWHSIPLCWAPSSVRSRLSESLLLINPGQVTIFFFVMFIQSTMDFPSCIWAHVFSRSAKTSTLLWEFKEQVIESVKSVFHRECKCTLSVPWFKVALYLYCNFYCIFYGQFLATTCKKICHLNKILLSSYSCTVFITDRL